MKREAVSIFFAVLICIGLVSCSKDEMKEQQLEIRSQLERAVADIDREIDKVGRQAETAVDSTKEKLERQIDQLDDARKNLKDNLEKVGDTTADKWDEFRREVDRSLENARLVMKDVRTNMNR